jgi:serine phosphatase RsbU (regulator of sigma subunit)
LGLIGDYEFAAVEEPFASGDRFAAFTDGLFEAADPAGEEFGIERLAQALGRSAHLPLGEALDAVMTAVAAFSGGSFGDDVCVIAADLKTA